VAGGNGVLIVGFVRPELRERSGNQEDQQRSNDRKTKHGEIPAGDKNPKRIGHENKSGRYGIVKPTITARRVASESKLAVAIG
jgi:hypothetical protein